MKRKRLSAMNTISALARSPLLDQLSGQELVVYIRLLEAVEIQRSRRVRVSNMDLHRHRSGRTAAAALMKLEGRGMIKVKRSASERTIQVIG